MVVPRTANINMPTQDVDIPEEHSSPSPLMSPSPALPSFPETPRYFSNASTTSVSSSSTRSASLGPSSFADSRSRDSSASFTTRSSSGSYTSRQSTGGLRRPRRRGYVRPQGTNFAASAQSRDSVMSLGSIAHLQYYFARTGLLDGKGGQLAKKKDPARQTLDLSSLDTNFLSPTTASDKDSSYSSMRSSPDLAPQSASMLVESPISNEPDSYEYSDASDDDPEMLPPTVSTYNYRTKPIPHPPTLAELKHNLKKALEEASKALAEAKAAAPVPTTPTIAHLRTPSTLSNSPSRRRSESDASLLTGEGGGPPSPNQGWYEVQGMHILDIITLAIRAARQYYTAHSNPLRLSAIKSERKIRTELLGVMEVLRRMATRNFSKGMRREEVQRMEDWVSGCWDMLGKEEELERLELEERRSWTWLNDSLWSGPEPNIAHELAFLQALNPAPELPLPAYAASNLNVEPPEPSEFLRALQSGLRLVELHNAMVKKSKRPFGAIPVFHTDTAKPYRCADNLRFWIKAAELRWEVILKVDVMGVVNGTDGDAWRGFETAVWTWSGKVREELGQDMKTDLRRRTVSRAEH